MTKQELAAKIWATANELHKNIKARMQLHGDLKAYLEQQMAESAE